jgi:hypothetical protein
LVAVVVDDLLFWIFVWFWWMLDGLLIPKK